MANPAVFPTTVNMAAHFATLPASGLLKIHETRYSIAEMPKPNVTIDNSSELFILYLKKIDGGF
jgi:hypothetical protein